jgi:hypothetical protein
MLAHSPPLPLVIDYFYKSLDITAEDEEGITLALEKRDRVRRVRLLMPATTLQKLIVTIDEEYPILEYLVIMPPFEDNSLILKFPQTLQAPHLRHLVLQGFALPIESRLLTNAVGLVTLYLYMRHPSSYFHPNTLLRWISLMPQLETLVIAFFFAAPTRDVGRQLTYTPIMTPITLPNLHRFWFRGVSAYLEALVRGIITPRLEKLEIDFFNQATFSVPRLMQCMNTIENLRFESAKFWFSTGRVYVGLYPREEEMYSFAMMVNCWHLDWQVSSVAQISNSLSPIFSTVDHLTLGHEVHTRSSEEHDEVDRTEWRKLLRSFSNVKTLHITNGFVEDLSRCLRLEDGELPLELLPELQELTCFGRDDTSDAFTSFIDARQNAGRPVTLVHRSPNSDPISSLSSFETLSITPAQSEKGSE